MLRLLDKNTGNLDLKLLGMTLAIREQFDAIIRKPHGIILVTGPTGSGKSTTLYAGLTEINSKDTNILTVEDPIEYELEGIGQTQVNMKADMSFARGLRAILRQDPDVVMIGEIRDLENRANCGSSIINRSLSDINTAYQHRIWRDYAFARYGC